MGVPERIQGKLVLIFLTRLAKVVRSSTCRQYGMGRQILRQVSLVWLSGTFVLAFATDSRATGVHDAKDFILGVDLSYVSQMEDCGVRYADGDTVMDPFGIFRQNGANMVRVRLFHTPDWTKYSTLADVKRTIRRARDQGFSVLLDFHYSDNWADPQRQHIPSAWKDLGSLEELEEAMYAYTFQTLYALHAAGLLPDMVQVGNETNIEILQPVGVQKETIDWPRNAALLNKGVRAVRDISELTGQAIEVMLHVAQPENIEPWFEQAIAHGVSDFDVIGVSYYSKWSSQSMREMALTLLAVRHRFSRDVIVVETGYPWTLSHSDEGHNLLGRDALVPGFKATKRGQRKYMIALTQAVIAAGGRGLFYWEPAWVGNDCPTQWGRGSAWENVALFDFSNPHRALPAMDFLSHGYVFPEPVHFQFEPVIEDPPEVVYLWGDFVGSNRFLIPLKLERGLYSYQTVVMDGERFRFQLYADSQLSEPLLKGQHLQAGFDLHDVLGEPQFVRRQVFAESP